MEPPDPSVAARPNAHFPSWGGAQTVFQAPGPSEGARYALSVNSPRRGVLPLLVLLLALLPSGTAAARVKTLHMRYGPIVLQPAELRARPTRVKTPQLRGFVTRMHAYIVGPGGQRYSPDQVMLHHAVF